MKMRTNPKDYRFRDIVYFFVRGSISVGRVLHPGVVENLRLMNCRVEPEYCWTTRDEFFYLLDSGKIHLAFD